MQEQLISKETAKLAEEKGFDWKHSDFYIDKRVNGDLTSLPCVPQSLLQKWLREKYNYHISVYRLNNLWCGDVYSISEQRYITQNAFNNVVFDTYEKALELSLFQALNLIK